jgi:preprotein translocase subunit SecY
MYLGAIILGLILVFSDLFNAIGSGGGILLAISTINEGIDVILKEEKHKSFFQYFL